MIHARLLSALTVTISLCTTAIARDDDLLQKVIRDRHADLSDLWIYNDLGKAIAEAKKQNKPLFVTFRCVPCGACESFDAEVAAGTRNIAKLARESFISVRQVEMKGVDLSWFQFDHDLNWAAMFVNADGTVYARYGTQSAEGPDAYNSVQGLENTMRRVLRLHSGYPENRAVLAGKRGAPRPFKTALEMPGLENKEKLRGPTARNNCIHCHNIHDAETLHAQKSGTFTQDMLWRFPLPENIGLVVDATDGRKITRVLPKSAAAGAGLKSGERLTHVRGQLITSIADIQWALHQLSNKDTKIQVRGSKTGKVGLTLEKGWKKTDISWRGSLWSIQPRLRVWTPPLTGEERKRHGLRADQNALIVKWINTETLGGRAARVAGLRHNDVILELDGKSVAKKPQRFNLHIKLNYKIGDELPLTVLRGGKKKEIRIRLVE